MCIFTVWESTFEIFLVFFFHFDKTASVNRIVKMMILFGGVSQMELPEDVDDHDL